jgi:hypothetical protein
MDDRTKRNQEQDDIKDEDLIGRGAGEDEDHEDVDEEMDDELDQDEEDLEE